MNPQAQPLDLGELEAPTRRAVPELARWPLYIVGPADLARWFGRWERQSLHGFWMPHLDLALRPHLEREGRWKGRGPAVFIDPAACLSSELSRRAAMGLIEPGPAHLRILAVRTAAATALHELAHGFDLGSQWRAPAPPGAEVARVHAGFAQWAPLAETTRPLPPWPWKHHGPRFLRLAACLAQRARTPLEDVVNLATYGLSGHPRLAEELRQDARRLEPLTLPAVARLRIAPGILAAWRDALADRLRVRRALAEAKAGGITQPPRLQRRSIA